jgi:hypothetical protein
LLNHVTRIYYIFFQNINEFFHSLLFFSRFDRIFLRKRRKYDYSKKKIKKKTLNRMNINVLMWLLTFLLYAANDVEDLCLTITRKWHFKSKMCVFLFRFHSAKKNEIERKRMWMWFLKSLFNVKHNNKTFYERIFRIFCFLWNACMYYFCYFLFYSKKKRKIEWMRISFSLLKENVKLFKKSLYYLHNLICSLILNLKSAFKLWFHVLL